MKEKFLLHLMTDLKTPQRPTQSGLHGNINEPLNKFKVVAVYKISYIRNRNETAACFCLPFMKALVLEQPGDVITFYDHQSSLLPQ